GSSTGEHGRHVGPGGVVRGYPRGDGSEHEGKGTGGEGPGHGECKVRRRVNGAYGEGEPDQEGNRAGSNPRECRREPPEEPGGKNDSAQIPRRSACCRDERKVPGAALRPDGKGRTDEEDNFQHPDPEDGD